jgi:VIT1/CCC1 family predicted Fe2+/Mn2+ transporter
MIQRYFHQLVTGVSFGLTSGVITALGMIVGLHSATSSKLAVVAGVVVMAIADGLADAVGIHIAEETEVEKGIVKHTQKEIWLSTLFAFLSVSGFILTFAIPILIFPPTSAILIAVCWGILLLVLLNFFIAKIKQENSTKLILEHVLLALFVIVISYGVGNLIAIWLEQN